jgi:hypothetical protein
MSSYLTAEQHQQLLRDLNPKRIGKDGKGFSHLQAWDCRAHMNRIFGFARWDEETPEMHLLFDTESEGNGKTRYTVAYKALVVVRVRAEDGTHLATYSEWAIGDSTNNPSHADAHDMAVKTAQSQAFKRCLVNLGTQWGLSLYSAGASRDVVGRTLIGPEGGVSDADAPVDTHITEPVIAEDAPPPEPAPDPREHNVEPEPDDKSAQVDAFVALVEQGPPEGTALVRWHAKLLARATAERLLNEEAPGGVTVKTFIDLARDSRRAS